MKKKLYHFLHIRNVARMVEFSIKDWIKTQSYIVQVKQEAY